LLCSENLNPGISHWTTVLKTNYTALRHLCVLQSAEHTSRTLRERFACTNQ